MSVKYPLKFHFQASNFCFCGFPWEFRQCVVIFSCNTVSFLLVLDMFYWDSHSTEDSSHLLNLHFQVWKFVYMYTWVPVCLCHDFIHKKSALLQSTFPQNSPLLLLNWSPQNQRREKKRPELHRKQNWNAAVEAQCLFLAKLWEGLSTRNFFCCFPISHSV